MVSSTKWFCLIALGTAVFITILCARQTMDAASVYIEADHLSGAKLLIWIAGWAIATYGPIVLAVGFWSWTTRTRRPWVLHVLLFPLAAVLFKTGASAMVWVVPEDPDFDGTLGGPILPALLLCLFAVGWYFVALVFKNLAKLVGRGSAR